MALTQRQRLHSAALQEFRIDRGTPYPCFQPELDFHHIPEFIHPNDKPSISKHAATEENMWHNEPRRTIPTLEAAAISRLQKSIKSFDARKETHGPDFLIKAFLDLDTVFFGGFLRGNVKVKWNSDATDPYLEKKSPLGYCNMPWTDGESRQTHITLNARALLEMTVNVDPWLYDAIATLLHEMIHAYFFVRCSGWRNGRAIPGFRYDCCHSHLFGSQISAVSKRCKTLLEFGAIHSWEPYRAHHDFSKKWDSKIAEGSNK